MSTQREIQKTECPNSDQQQHFAIFFISTGRCGTQWLASSLGEHYSDLAEVTHEPMQVEYEPRRLFQACQEGIDVKLPTAIEEHLRNIEETLESKHYIETGWPVYGELPALLRRLSCRVKIVHLVRCPLRSAVSLSTHKVFQRGEWSDVMLPECGKTAVSADNFSARGSTEMSEFEKCVNWWCRLHRFGIELRRVFPHVPWETFRFEDIFNGDATFQMKELIEFLTLPVRSEVVESRGRKVDQWSFKTTEAMSLETLLENPDATRLMDRFDYSLSRNEMRSAMKRYNYNALHGVRQLIKKAIGMA